VLAELGRIDREQPPVRPGSVQSTDGSTVRIPGPLDDVGRDGHTLVYDEDLHQPVWRPAASGGIVGMAEVISTNGTVQHLSGNVNMSYTGVTYNSPSDPFAGTGGASTAAVSSWLSVSGYELTLSPGWYVPVLYVRLRWGAESDAPPALSLYMGGGVDSIHNDSAIFTKAALGGGGWGIQQTINFGHTYVGEGDTLHAEVRGSGAAPTGDAISALSAIVWNITKLA